MTIVVKATKAAVPPRNGGALVMRPRLEERSGMLLEAPVTLVRAGGGFGKTTLLQEWVDQLRPTAAVAWLSLDEYDASGTALCEALNTALRSALPGFGTSVRALLDRGIDDPRRLASALSNELLAWSAESPRDAVIFLDDVQFVAQEPAAVALLGELLTGLPDGIHAVLASRAPLQFAPLGKLRATNRLNEIDQDELRFTREEAEALIGSGEHTARYFDFTEGWPMALGLIAHIVRTKNDGFDASLQRTRDSLFGFLAEEVVARLPVELVEKLGVLAIPPSLQSASAKVLADVDDVDAFVRTLSAYGLYVGKEQDGTWRLHALFRSFLLERSRRTDAAVERSTRVRYAQWLREQGRKTEALEQLVEAGEYEEIVAYVSEALVAIHFSDRYKYFVQLLSTVPDRVMREKPMLHRFYARAQLRSGNNEVAQEQLLLCYERALANDDYTTACAAQIELGILADQFYFLRRNRYERSEQCFLKALELAQRPELAHMPIALNQCHWHLGMVYAARSDFERALAHLRMAEEYERTSSRHVDHLFIELAIVHGWRGDWMRSLEYAELAEELFRSGGGEFWIGNALIQQARAHTQLRTEPARAVQLARTAIHLLQQGHREDDLAEAYVVAGHAYLASDPPALDDAVAAARAADEALARFAHPVVQFDNELLKTEIAIFARREDDARRHLADAHRLANASNDPWQSAMASFYDGARELAFGDENVARELFATSASELARLQDRSNAAMAKAALLASDARAQRLDAGTLRAFLAQQREFRLEYAMRSAPRSAAVLLAWALAHDDLIEDAVDLLAAGAAGHPQPLIDAARDVQLPAAGRAASIGLLAKVAPALARSTIAQLTSDADPVVANSATTALRFLPSATAPPLHLGVASGMRVRVGDNEFDESSERWGRRRAAELLRLLTVMGTGVTKSAVFAALWPDNPAVTDTTLRVTLHMVRRALQPSAEGSGDYIEYDGSVVRLRSDLVAGIDVVQADAAIRRAQVLRAQGDVENARVTVAQAIAVFAQAPREEDASEWLRPYVRTWRENAVAAYLLLADIERGTGRRNEAIDATQRALALDPLNETAVCALLDALLDTGKNEAARGIFTEYRRRLSQQLDVSPGPAVMERYTRIAARVERPVSASPLSEREHEVLSLVARGLSNKQIASELSLSTWTVNNHIAKILRKLNVESRTAAVAAVSSGWGNG